MFRALRPEIHSKPRRRHGEFHSKSREAIAQPYGAINFLNTAINLQQNCWTLCHFHWVTWLPALTSTVSFAASHSLSLSLSLYVCVICRMPWGKGGSLKASCRKRSLLSLCLSLSLWTYAHANARTHAHTHTHVKRRCMVGYIPLV
jgi:hypothetical protein